MSVFQEQAGDEVMDIATGQTRSRASISMPALILSTCSNFNLVWWGSAMHGSCASVQVHRPQPSASTSFIIGDAGVYGSNAPTGAAVIVQSVNDPNGTLMQPPTGWNQVWNDRGSGGSNDGAIWSARAPDGFIGIGAVANNGYDAPTIPNYRCIDHNLLTQVNSGLTSIWKDQGSHADEDVEFWAIPGLPNAFVTSNNYDNPPPSGAFVFKSGQ